MGDRHPHLRDVEHENPPIVAVVDGEPQVDLVLAELDDVRDALEWALAADIMLAAELFTKLEVLLVTTAPPERLCWADALLENDASLPPEGARSRDDPRLPAGPFPDLDGKEGVDGSSPSEGLCKTPARRRFRNKTLLQSEHGAVGMEPCMEVCRSRG